jgi:hypothetical protein
MTTPLPPNVLLPATSAPFHVASAVTLPVSWFVPIPCHADPSHQATLFASSDPAIVKLPPTVSAGCSGPTPSGSHSVEHSALPFGPG